MGPVRRIVLSLAIIIAAGLLLNGTFRANRPFFSPTVTEYALPQPAGGIYLDSIHAGPNGQVWIGALIRSHSLRDELIEVTTNGVATVVPIPWSIRQDPNDPITGPDGNYWYAVDSQGLARVTASNVFTLFKSPSSIYIGRGASLVLEPDKSIWFGEGISGSPGVGRLGRQHGWHAWLVSGYYIGVWKLINGPDGNIWFTNNYLGHWVGRASPGVGAIREFGLPSDFFTSGIAAGSDGNVWVTEAEYQGQNPGNRIAKIMPNGQYVLYTMPPGYFNSGWPVLGPDHNIWFLDQDSKNVYIASITPLGSVTQYTVAPLPAQNTPYATDLLYAPDGNFWFLLHNSIYGYDSACQVTTSGHVTPFKLPGTTGSYGGSASLVVGPDANLWTTYPENSMVAKIAIH